MIKHTLALAILFIFCAVVQGNAQQKHESCPMNKGHQSGRPDKTHDKHFSEVNRRGDHAMGFSHEKATHRFKLTADGGTIEVTANDPADVEGRDQARPHLAEIAGLFKAGDFEKPMFTHGKVPPGVPAMKRLKAEINYKYDAVDRGGRVRIITKNQDALRAVHEFLRFQIEEHQTGDSLEVEKQD